MWYRTTLAITLTGLLLGLGIGASKIIPSMNTPSGVRAPSSVMNKNSWRPLPLGKHLALIKTELSQPEVIPEDGDDEVTLNGRIHINQSISGGISYSWILPNEVEIVRGDLTKTIEDAKMGDLIEVSITVRGFNKEKQRLIFLKAVGKHGGEVLGNSSTIASRPEDTWESIAPEMKKAAEEQLEEADASSSSEISL